MLIIEVIIILIDKFSMSVNDNLLFAKRNIVDSIYKEAKLEGIAVTYPDTNEIFNVITVAGLSVDDTIKINNLKHAWEFVLTTLDYPISLRYIRQINSEIGRGIVFREGILRDADVSIGGTSWKPDIPNENKVEGFIEDIIKNTDNSATDRAVDTMLYVMRSQLFFDGNKRTAQLLANKIMIENGVGIISIPVEDQREFMNLLIDFYETNNSDTIKEFVYERCIDGYGIGGRPVVQDDELDTTIQDNNRK